VQDTDTKFQTVSQKNQGVTSDWRYETGFLFCC
jgi:hypothetical protein